MQIMIKHTYFLCFFGAIFCRAISLVICADSSLGIALTKQSHPVSVSIILGTVRKKATKEGKPNFLNGILSSMSIL